MVSPASTFDIRPKSSSWLMRTIAKLPFIPKTFMTKYWTTIRNVVYTPTKYDADLNYGSLEWLQAHLTVITHERKHIERWRKWRTPLYETAYIGPSVPLAALTLVSLPFGVWWLSGVLGALTAALLPLSAGLAYGRWFIEREAYLLHMRQLDAIARLRYIERTVDKLWEDYAWTWPKPWMRRWFKQASRADHAAPSEQ